MSLAQSVIYPRDKAAIIASAGNRRLSSYTLSFEGSAREYFPVWIVNLFLSIITFGLYSPWAKVRKQKYFYGSTRLAGSSFEYLGDPLVILKGRLIAAAVVAVYWFGISVYPVGQAIFLIGLFLAMPWLVVNALRFRARNSAFRNLRFNFRAGYREAFKAYVLWPLVGVITLGIFFPYAAYRQKALYVENTAYGDAGFAWNADGWSVYRIYLMAFAIVAVGIVGAVLFSSLHPLAGTAVIWASYFLAYVYIKTEVTNLVFNAAVVNGVRFKSRLQFGTLLELYFTNLLAIVASAGLLTPWAQIRLAQYRAQCLTVVPNSGIEHFCADQSKFASAAGEELGNFFDVDLSL